ncbi:hypothetical protein BDB00DRAFT_804285 [Zychaea mexicana]|uniref:uncharacterized protein n=1 Tax=Zychaea mexicana TaxID=64656 RepID=UPI0022FEEF99|nr:uncharacterized protein BDB00DRAFT_804285 [Zychaea mexicana]KAI9497389.1 hypothetical protein BDB00DRAFT_804285 [Zychaea mexicana]
MATLRKKARDTEPLDPVSVSEKALVEEGASSGGALRSWFRLFACWVFAIAVATHLHYKLPEPKSHRGVDPTTGNTEFSEHNAMETIAYLSDTLGYRIVGTVEEAQTFDYLESAVRAFKSEAQGISGAPKFDIWVQQATGTHRFDIMDNMVFKAYTNVTNIIVRLSCPETESRACEDNAILLNSHFDTTLGSPGATDDGSGVAVMLEIIRVMSRRDWSGYRNSIVFLFNGAEESLQDASHAFITMHEIKDSIRSVVNIDACGTSGREILFQANSREMIDAYKQAPYPHGTVVANDVFRTGLILSDTDFRQFVQYGNLTGIDMAIYKNSYLYHTHLDLTENLEPGAIQHLGENTLAIVDYLAKNSTLSNIERTSEVVFFDFQGLFFVVYSWATAFKLQMGAVFFATILFAFTVYKTAHSSPYRTIPNIVACYIKTTASIFLSAVAALVLPVLVALFLTSDPIGRNMAWFAREWYGAVIFCPMSLIGMYGVQYLLYALPGPQHVDMEYGAFVSLTVAFAISTFLTTLTSVASSYIFWLYLSILFVATLLNEFVWKPKATKSVVWKPQISGLTYIVCAFPMTLLYTDYTYAMIDIFVPLTGRMGFDTPVDIIIAVVFGMVTFMTTLPSLAHVHRFGKRFLRKILVALVMLQVAVLGAVVIRGGTYGGWAFPYDEFHPKRLFVQHLKNLTSGESHVGFAEADHGPYIETVVTAVEDALGVKAEARHGSENANEWASIYPFSAFLGGYRFNTKSYLEANGVKPDDLPGPFPKLSAQNDKYDPATGVRSFSIVSVSPTYTWTVIAFDADVLTWSITDSEPLEGPTHYIVRHVVGHGNDAWKLDLSVRVPEDKRAEAKAGKWKMRFEFTALEKENFAGHGIERPTGGVGILGVVRDVLPIWTTPTWLSSVVKVWEL